MITKARDFAIQAHGPQKYGEQPYSVHLDSVAAIAQEYGELAQIIAYLHDVVEDTAVGIADIEREFGELVAKCVAILSDEPGASRKERKKKTYEKMARVRGPEEIALLVKAADRLANMRACCADNNDELFALYRQEYPVFRRSAYRPGQCEAIWAELDAMLEAN
jgi:(p)ppGpp synthase/HD superfamily hydrolase